MLRTMNIDLVICMPGNADNDAFSVARHKSVSHDTLQWCYALLPRHNEAYAERGLEHFDYVFCWLGNTNLILSIIKLIEDKMNLDRDVREGGRPDDSACGGQHTLLQQHPAQSL